jgi:hypothetical protein
MPGVMQTIAGTIAVCEPRPFLTPALQREFEHTPYHVRGCRSTRELPSLITTPFAVIVCDITTHPADGLNWFTTPLSQRWPSVVCGSPTVAELEPVFRELGVRSFLPDLISPQDLAQLCRRWLARQSV